VPISVSTAATCSLSMSGV